MTVPPLNAVAHQLCSWADARAFADRTDGEVLDRFVECQDEGAFAALLGRHGPMVLRVARRMLGRAHDAEDVFQATFLLRALSLALRNSGPAVRAAAQQAVVCWRKSRRFLSGSVQGSGVAGRLRRTIRQRRAVYKDQPGAPATGLLFPGRWVRPREMVGKPEACRFSA